jgi:hypothetical protein
MAVKKFRNYKHWWGSSKMHIKEEDQAEIQV